MTRPALRRIPLASVNVLQPGQLTITMSPGQWDMVLAVAYDMGVLLLELDDDEQLICAYQSADPKWA